MKIVAVMITWNNIEFFKRALDQAIGFCDEVILSEGCSSRNYPRQSTDGTREYIDKMKDNPKLKIVDIDYNEFKNSDYVSTQWAIRQIMIDQAGLFIPGNWYTSWDDDQFFFDEDLINLRQIMEQTDSDTLMFHEWRFVYNFRFSTQGPGNWYFHRITGGCHLKPLMHLCYYDGMVYSKRKEKCHRSKIFYFHYPYVKKSERIKARWAMSAEKGTKASIGQFEKWMKLRWINDEDMIKNAKLIEAMQGQGHFNIYTGAHPEVLDDHPWRYIDDIREIK